MRLAAQTESFIAVALRADICRHALARQTGTNRLNSRTDRPLPASPKEKPSVSIKLRLVLLIVTSLLTALIVSLGIVDTRFS
jgi:hypothetical protein